MLPVFIGGHPRSGTTLLGAMIGAHSDSVCTPESQFKTRVLRHSSIGDKGTINIQTAFHLIQKNWRFNIWSLHIHSIPYDEIHSYQELILWIVKVYGEKFGKSNASIWVDHTPSNIKNADTLLELFPEAKFIDIVRDGRAVASSIMPLDWGANTIDTAAHSWVKRLSHYLTVESSLGDKKIIRVRFEDLVQEPETTLRKVCLFLNIDYQTQMVQGGGLKVPQYTFKQHSLIGKGPDPKEVNAWEKELTPRQVEIFESIAGKLLISLGYKLRYGLHVKKMTRTERFKSKIQEIYRREIVNKARHRRRINKGIEIASKHSE